MLLYFLDSVVGTDACKRETGAAVLKPSIGRVAEGRQHVVCCPFAKEEASV